jgi:uncharacterized protein
VLLALPLGFVIGISLGLVGAGGAVLTVPAMVYLLGQDVHSSTTASLAIVALAALAGGGVHARAGCVCWRVGLSFLPPAALGGAAGTAANASVAPELLVGAFGATMAAVAATTWWRSAPARFGGAIESDCPAVSVRATILVALAVGFLTGFLGVGGGFLAVPALTIWLGLDLRHAMGTSLLIVSLASLTSLGSHLAAGAGADWLLVATLGSATVAGSLVGAALARHVPARLLARGFAALVALVGGYLLLAAVVLGVPD